MLVVANARRSLVVDRIDEGRIERGDIAKTPHNREGDEVAQLYLIPPSGNGYVLRSLEGFERVHLAPHASSMVHFKLDPRELSEVDDNGHRAVRAGDYDLADEQMMRAFCRAMLVLTNKGAFHGMTVVYADLRDAPRFAVCRALTRALKELNDLGWEPHDD